MFNPLQLVRRPISFGSWMSLVILAIYTAAAAIVFVQVVNPSLTGDTSQHIAADSGLYMYMADVLREHRDDPRVYAALASFPNTLWMPVAIAWLLKSTLLIVVFNAVLFCGAVSLYRRIFPLDTIRFCLLLALNATTVISIMSVNKEIVDLFVLALFYFSFVRHRKLLLAASLVLALLNRYEVFIALVIFMLARTRMNPWGTRRWSTLAVLLLALSILLPLSAAHSLAYRFQEAEGGGLVTVLDQMEIHFLFFVASVPKIAENLFGALLSPGMFARFGELDIANSWILLLNNIATVFVLVRLGLRRRLTRHAIELDWMYLMAIISIIMSVALVIQPRYFYLVYVILCLEAARRNVKAGAADNPAALTEGLVHA